MTIFPRSAKWLPLALLCGCVAPGQRATIQAGGDAESRQTQSLAAIERATVQIAASMPAVVATVDALSPKAGGNQAGQIGLLNIANTDVTSQIPAAGTGILAGLIWLRSRRRLRHAWSLGKSIRALHDEFGRENPVLVRFRKQIEEITRADGTEADNEQMVRRFRDRGRKSGI